jgi:predicted hotdog family 3-hydroxylacyl-ACP dehydratase
MARQLPRDRQEIEALIPHAGAMCLLARVLSADDQTIVCEADGHRDPTNPLRNERGLPVSAGIEYAAQAVAIHGSLQRDVDAPVQSGSLAVLSDVRWSVDRLDEVADPLAVRATLLSGTAGGKQYSFEVSAGAGEPLVQGTLIIALS